MKKPVLFLLLLIPLLLAFLKAGECYAQSSNDPEKARYLSGKIEKYLDKEKALSGYYNMEPDGITMYASAENKSRNKPEFSLKFDQLESFKREILKGNGFDWYKKGQYDPPAYERTADPAPDRSKMTLKGYKIAIDAGHIAGNFITGDLEKKHLKFKADTTIGLPDSIEIAEGMLTYATAILLKEKLEAQGADVLLTRKCGDCTAFGSTYQEWKRTAYTKTVDTLYTLGKISLSQKKFFQGKNVLDRDIFRVIFRDWELQERGRIINAWRPDFAVIIHYNVDETNLEWQKPSNKNFNMCFVGGAFMKGDLSAMEKRFEFLRLLITDDLEQSIKLSEAVLKKMETSLGVPSAGINDAKYLKEGCLPAGYKGIYCRNLQLPRYIHCPLVYGETLYQDNIKECQALNRESDKTKNERVKQVADAYYHGILNYAGGIK